MTKPTKTKSKKRCMLALPEPLHNELKKVAEENNTTLVSVLQNFIRLGLYALEIEKSPNSELYIKEDNEFTKIKLFF